MCGRYTLTPAIDELLQQLGLAGVLEEMGPRFNVAPTQMVPALRLNDEGALQLDLFRWGLVPSWAKDPSIGNRMINARGETVAEKPSFRSAFRSRRCLVLTDGWYEWQKNLHGKQPVRIQLESGEAFSFGGLWERWRPKGAGAEEPEEMRTCTIITCDANEALADIHHRMPVVMKRTAWDTWLDPEAPSDVLLSMLRPYAEDDLKAYPVSTLVNSPANERPECILPL
jgi:putative SOS response-associated peptidase YedK